MQIACEKCSTTYVLDEKLLPATGAPVQCTRCQHVFIAKPAGQKPPETAPAPQRPSAPQATRPGTQVFGAVQGGARAPAPDTAQGPARGAGPRQAPRAGTQVFGSAPSTPPGGAPERSSTQTFGAVGRSGGTTPPQGSPVPPPRAGTQVFGAVAPSTPSAPPRTAERDESRPTRDGTQLFGKLPDLGPGPGEGSLPAAGGAAATGSSRASTQGFGAVGTASTTEPGGSVGTPRSSTQVFGSVPPGLTRGASVAPPSAASSSPPSRIELPPEPGSPGVTRGAPVGGSPPRRHSSSSMSAAPGSSAGLPATQARRGGTGGKVWVLLILAALVVAALGWFMLWGGGSTRGAEVSALLEEVNQLIRRDDTTARARALELLRAAAIRHGGDVNVRSEYVTTLALSLDDVRLMDRLLADETTRLQERNRRLERRRSPVDWGARIESNKGRLAVIEARRVPLEERIQELRSELSEAVEGWRRPSTVDATPEMLRRFVRAQALYHGVIASPRALAHVEEYRRLGGRAGWDAVARAEYAVNTRTAPKMMQDIVGELESAVQADITFIRPYVLAARLFTALDRPREAAASLETVTAFNPDHEIAAAMLASLRDPD